MVSSGVAGQAASPCLCSTLVPLVADVPFSPQPPSRQEAEEESTSSTALGARPPDTSLSLPTSPDKQPPWPRAFPLLTVEEKQWHQPGSIQTNIVPINVSGRAALHGAEGERGVQAEMRPRSHLGQGRVVGGGCGCELCSCGLGGHWGREGIAGPCWRPSFPAIPRAICSFVHLVRWPCCWQVSHPQCNAQPARPVVTRALTTRRAPSLSHLPPVCPSAHPLGAAPPSSALLPSPCRHRCHVLAQVRVWGWWLGEVPLLKGRGFCPPFPSVMESCARAALVPLPLHGSCTRPQCGSAQRCGIRPLQHRPVPVTQRRAAFCSFPSIPPPSAAFPTVPPCPPCSPHMAHTILLPSHTPTCVNMPGWGQAENMGEEGAALPPRQRLPAPRRTAVCFGYRAALC